MHEKPFESPYCLYCYAPLVEVEAPSTHCPRCNHANLVVDLRRLWTREHKVREYEQLLKALVVIGVAAISLAMLFNPGTGVSGAGHGMAVGAPILLGILLWDAASISQRTSVFRGSLIWPIVGGVFLLPAMLFFAASPTPGLRLIASLVLAASLAGLASPFTRRRWLSWRERRIATRQASLGS